MKSQIQVEGDPADTDQLSHQASEPSIAALSLRQPAWHVLLLGVLTCKLYLVYWYYKNLRDLSRHMKATTEAEMPDSSRGLLYYLLPEHLSKFREASLLLRTICACIPYINDYLFLTIALGVARLQPKDSFVGKHPVTIAALLVVFSVALSLQAFQHGAWYFLYFLSVLPAMFVQHLLNKYWDTAEPTGLLCRAGFTLGELVIIIVGALFLGFIIAGFIMGANPS